jgi:hypothetical protein
LAETWSALDATTYRREILLLVPKPGHGEDFTQKFPVTVGFVFRQRRQEALHVTEYLPQNESIDGK